MLAGVLLTAVLAVATPASQPGICPLTLPTGGTPPGEQWAGTNYGKGELWTTFWPRNVVIADAGYVQPDGSIAMKWPWFRGVKGQLVISGRRLDGNAPPILQRVSSDGYGSTGFLPTSIVFPTEGCWEVTGAVGKARLTFVTMVLKASSYSLVARF